RYSGSKILEILGPGPKFQEYRVSSESKILRILGPGPAKFSVYKAKMHEMAGWIQDRLAQNHQNG
uniref:Uncharacterized protein n=1 Tax=Romanomermis culicivorax TaxID=13658 RepID=A0A915L5D6_ROMCU